MAAVIVARNLQDVASPKTVDMLAQHRFGGTVVDTDPALVTAGIHHTVTGVAPDLLFRLRAPYVSHPRCTALRVITEDPALVPQASYSLLIRPCLILVLPGVHSLNRLVPKSPDNCQCGNHFSDRRRYLRSFDPFRNQPDTPSLQPDYSQEAQQIYQTSSIQDGISSSSPSRVKNRLVGSYSGLEGRIPTCPDSHFLQEMARLRHQRKHIPFSVSSIRPVNSTPHIHSSDEGHSRVPSETRDLRFHRSGRLASDSSIPLGTKRTDHQGTQAGPASGLHCQLPQVFPSSIPKSTVHGSKVLPSEERVQSVISTAASLKAEKAPRASSWICLMRRRLWGSIIFQAGYES